MEAAKLEISELILNSYNIDINIYDNKFISNMIIKRMSETCCESESDYISLIRNSEEEQKTYLCLLQVSYTEFFRNQLTFSVLEKIILPGLLQRKLNFSNKEIRIWSAACAGGHEVYSLSILLHEILEKFDSDFKIRIFATDISPIQIEGAKKGIFPESALGNVTLNRLNSWFEKSGNMYMIKDQIKNSIEFTTFDLLDKKFHCPPTSIFGDFDIIFCANLLFYYTTDIQTDIIEKTFKSLKPNGYFITGETEIEILKRLKYIELYPQSGIFVNH